MDGNIDDPKWEPEFSDTKSISLEGITGGQLREFGLKPVFPNHNEINQLKLFYNKAKEDGILDVEICSSLDVINSHPELVPIESCSGHGSKYGRSYVVIAGSKRVLQQIFQTVTNTWEAKSLMEIGYELRDINEQQR